MRAKALEPALAIVPLAPMVQLDSKAADLFP